MPPGLDGGGAGHNRCDIRQEVLPAADGDGAPWGILAKESDIEWAIEPNTLAGRITDA